MLQQLLAEHTSFCAQMSLPASISQPQRWAPSRQLCLQGSKRLLVVNRAEPKRLPSRVQEIVSSPATMISAAFGFSLVAAGVFIPTQKLVNAYGAAQAAIPDAAMAAAQPAAVPNPGILLSLDAAVHDFVARHTSAGFRYLAADIFISDAFITAGLIGWVACSMACLTRSKDTAGPISLAWTFYVLGCGAVSNNDPPLVALLKEGFSRPRPSALHHTYAFPSGHTTAAVFIVGALLTVLLPMTLKVMEREPHSWSQQLWMWQQGSSSSESISKSSNKRTEGAAAQLTASKTVIDRSSSNSSSGGGYSSCYDAATLAVWGAAWVVTASGRILADVHWLSDTLAGGLLAVSCVSGLAWSCRQIEAKQQQQ